MNYSCAQLSDIDAVLALHSRYQVDSIAEEDKKDGFVTTAFSASQLQALIEQEQGLFIAKDGEQVVGYVMAASWQFWSPWPLFAHMIEQLSQLSYLGQTLSVENSYQYGPICIDKAYRGSQVLPELFDFSRAQMAKRFPILVTFVNKINPRSFAAHHRKLGLEVIQEFEFNNNHYYELVYDTSQPIECHAA